MRRALVTFVLIALIGGGGVSAQDLGASGSLLTTPTGQDVLTPLPPVTAAPVVDPSGASATPGGDSSESVVSAPTLLTWGVQADAMLLQRSVGSKAYLGETSIGLGGAVVDTLHANDVAYTQQPGMRLALTCNVDEQIQWEIVYFGLQNWSTSRTLLADPLNGSLASSPFTQVDKLIGGFGQSLGYSYKSQLENVELNARRRYMIGPWTLSPLAGFRFVSWNENISLTGSDQFFDVSENITSKSNNYLFGLQGGADARWTWKRLSLSATGKAGIFANFIQNSLSNANSTGISGIPGAGGFIAVGTKPETLGAAGVVDLSVVASYRLGQHFALRGGYQLLYVAGLALAPDQLSGTTSHHADILLQGPTAGFEANW